jgi:hypothetical protein
MHGENSLYDVRTKLLVEETPFWLAHAMAIPSSDRSKVGRFAAVIVIVVILVATIAFVSSRTATQPPSPSTSMGSAESPSVSTNTTSAITATGPFLLSFATKVSTPWFGLLNTGASSATICFQIYEFNSTSTVTLNTTKLLSITGFPAPLGGSVFSGIQNFTISPSIAQVTLGGPNDTNEGTIIAYTISARPGASGTYFIELEGFLLGGEGPGELCTGGAGELVAGNGQPNYALPGSCVLESPISPGHTYAIPGVGYDVYGNVLYYRIYGAGNATQ